MTILIRSEQKRKLDCVMFYVKGSGYAQHTVSLELP
jgi:hypothetical protein